MFSDRIVAAEKSLKQQHSILALTGLDKQLEWPDPVNQLVMSSTSGYMFSPNRIHQPTFGRWW